MSFESDGVHDEVAAKVRVAVTLAEQIARQREQQARAAEAQSEHAARAYAQRLQAERAQLAPIKDNAWWEQATPEQIGAAWQTAGTWREPEPEARDAAKRIGGEVRAPYGVDVIELTVHTTVATQAASGAGGPLPAGRWERAAAGQFLS